MAQKVAFPYLHDRIIICMMRENDRRDNSISSSSTACQCQVHAPHAAARPSAEIQLFQNEMNGSVSPPRCCRHRTCRRDGSATRRVLISMSAPGTAALTGHSLPSSQITTASTLPCSSFVAPFFFFPLILSQSCL